MLKQEEFVAMIKQNETILLKIVNFYTDTKEDGEDLKQEIIYQLWRSWNSFKGQSKRSSWLYRVALNTALLNLKKKKSQIRAASLLEVNSDPTSEFNIEKNEKVQQLYSAIKQLSALDRALILLVLEEKAHADIGHILGLSTSNVGTRISRIKKKLQSFFQQPQH
ncbi:MAG: sigma-70 family RNA polymerase sigma factor [Bacteroidota bacterium]